MARETSLGHGVHLVKEAKGNAGCRSMPLQPFSSMMPSFVHSFAKYFHFDFFFGVLSFICCSGGGISRTGTGG